MIFYNLTFSDLQLDMKEIYLNSGYGGHAPDNEIAENIEKIIVFAQTFCIPRAGYKVYNINSIDKNFIEINKVSMKTGPIITKYLLKSTHIAVFVATAGKEYDDYLQKLKAEGDLVNEFLADAVGSEIAEATVRFITDKVTEEAKIIGHSVTKPYSPGYCRWHVREQKQLFSFLTDQPCGIKLNDSFMMHPIKSVSGIIGIGTEVEYSPYACEICGLKSCYKRKDENK
jgi:hypothetical protein